MPSETARVRRTRRIGIGMIAVGLVTIVGAVLFVLEQANGPGTGPKSFARRRSYDQVKVEVHRTFPVALLVGLGGLVLAWTGTRLLPRSGPGSKGASEE